MILERVFRGEFVPQDPADESADALLARESGIDILLPIDQDTLTNRQDYENRRA